MYDITEAIARLFVEATKKYVSDPVRVELLDGKGRGTRLAATMGWRGDHWRIMIDRNIGSAWTFWKALWHELGHVHFGQAKKVDKHDAVDRALIAGVKSGLTEARSQGYDLARDDDLEARCNAWALERAKQWLPCLNDFLSRVEDRVTVSTPEDRRAKAAIIEAKLAEYKYTMDKALKDGLPYDQWREYQRTYKRLSEPITVG